MAALSNITSLSAGLLVNQILSGDAGLLTITSRIFHVIAEQGASLPYVCYRRASLDDVAVKGAAGADMCAIEIDCYASTYAGSIELAEAVRAALDNVQGTYTDNSGRKLIARSIRLTDSEEGWADDSYFQSLIFTVRIN